MKTFVKCEWHNYPISGCERKAVIFCKSLVKESIGIIPAHRAFCKECFERAIKMPDVAGKEIVSYEEWKILRGIDS
jgi:hypothetical protein